MPSEKKYHRIERASREREPDIGHGDESLCLPGWIHTICEKFAEGNGYILSHSALEALGHTLIAARARAERLVRERDEALARLEKQQ